MHALKKQMEERIFPITNQKYHDINPLLCGYQICEKGHSFGPAMRDLYLIHYITNGKGVFFSHGTSHILQKGNMFLIRPGEITYYQADNSEPWEYVWIGFNGKLADKLLTADVPDTFYSPQMSHIFAELRNVNLSSHKQDLYICSKIYEILSLIEATDQPVSSPESYVRQARDYILANYANHITIEGIARVLGIDRRYLTTLFKSQYAVSPKQFLLNVRIDKAHELLCKTNMPIADIARSVGYEDALLFSKTYKIRTGKSPSQARRKA